MSAKANVQYDGILVGDCHLTGTLIVPEDMIGRTKQLHQEGIRSESLLNFLAQYMGRSHRGKAIEKVIDLKVKVTTEDRMVTTGFFQRGLDVASIPAGAGVIQLIPMPEEKKAAPEPETPTAPRTPRMGYIPCPKCKGRGSFPSKDANGESSECRKCHGSGEIYDLDTFKEQKDAALPKDKQREIERESEDMAFSRFVSKRSR
jgi:hypothetical protein